MAFAPLRLRTTLRDHSLSVTFIDAHGDSILTSSRDRSHVYYSIDPTTRTPSFRCRLVGPTSIVTCGVLSPSSEIAASASFSSDIHVFDLSSPSRSPLLLLDCSSNISTDVLAVSFSPDGRVLASASRDRSISLWDPHNGECLYTVSVAHRGWVTAIRFSPDLDQIKLVSVSADGMAKLWYLTPSFTLRHRKTFTGHDCSLTSVDVCPDGSVCATAGRDGMILLWNIIDGDSWSPLDTLNAQTEVYALSFCPTQFMLCATTGYGVVVWDLETKKALQVLHPEAMSSDGEMLSCTSLCWSKDGRDLFVGYNDGTVRVWESNAPPVDAGNSANRNGNTGKIVWSKQDEEWLIFLMEEEVLMGCKPISTFPKVSWRCIRERINLYTGNNYSQTQLRNKFNQLRNQQRDISRKIQDASEGARSEKARILLLKSIEKDCPMFGKLSFIFGDAASHAHYLYHYSGPDDGTPAKGAASSAKLLSATTVQENAARRPSSEHPPLQQTTSATPSSEQPPSLHPYPEASSKWLLKETMRVLNSLPKITGITYARAVEKFGSDETWMLLFLEMPEHRRLDWLQNLSS